MPSSTRRPFFDGWETKGASYGMSCPKCAAPISLGFTAILEGAWGWRERFTAEETAAIESVFELGEKCKALDDGWPSVTASICSGCGARHVFYADLDEYSNSCYRIVAQGLATVSLNNSMQATRVARA
jgi:hypothetical protein